MAEADYVRSTESWRASLEADIRREDGPLALVGLFWVQNGVNTVGSSRDCTFCLPKPAPRLIGAFDYDGVQLKFRGDVGQVAEIDGVQEAAGVDLKLHTGASPSRIRLGDLMMAPVQFGGKLGIQVWDRVRPGAATNPPRNWFSIDDRFVVRATYTPYPAPVKLSMPDSLGGLHTGYAQGYVSFKLEGRSHNLDATEVEGGRLLLQFRDRTNGVQTYSEGRFLQTDVVSEDGSLLIDFNRSFNPPSAFTSFMPAALPPKTHILNCAVEAGERIPTPSPEST